MRRSEQPLAWYVWLPAALLLLPILLAEIYAFVPPPFTPLMLWRLAHGYPLHEAWVPLNRLGPYLPKDAIAAEDNLFCRHSGFDWKALGTAFDVWQNNPQFTLGSGKNNQKGGSTISQQTAKNVFLWSGRDLLRKGLEFPLTVLIENLWGKQRILEVYLNRVEFGPGLYGVAAASQYYFHTTPAKLSPRQAAALIAVLPKPLHWAPVGTGPDHSGRTATYVRGRSAIIAHRATQLGALASCTR